MDMSNMDMSSQATPANINEPYANTLITILASTIAFLAVRHTIRAIYKKTTSISSLKPVENLLSPIARYYESIETFIINKSSFRMSAYSPPLGAFLLTLALTSAILPLLLLNVDLKLNSNRAGFLAIAMVPFLLSSTGKNSALSLLTGISPMRLNFLHRLLGLALFICATVHMSCMLHAWSKFPTFLQSELQLPKVKYGLAGYGCLCILILGSAWPVRVFCYEVFLATHLLGFVFIGLIAVHTPYAMRYFFTGIACYALNLVAVWFVKTYIATARFEALPGGCTKVFLRLASPIKTHDIGQHVMLCIPAISPFEWHPFTITSVAYDQQQQHAFSAPQSTLEVCICVRGNYTRKVYEMVNNTTSQEMRVFVSGPFGGKDIQPRELLEQQSSIAIATGGAGVTFGMRVLRQLVYQLTVGEHEKANSPLLTNRQWCKTENIYFYWSVRRALELSWFQEELEEINSYMDRQSEQQQFPKLHIKLFITSKLATNMDDTLEMSPLPPTSEPMTTGTSTITSSGIIQEDIDSDEINVLYFNKNNVRNEDQDITTSYSRKAVNTTLGQRMQAKNVLQSVRSGNAAVLVCGPRSFNTMFQNAVARQESSSIYLHCETFGY